MALLVSTPYKYLFQHGLVPSRYSFQSVRCQMVHGGATYKSGKNRRSVNDCNILLNELINAICLILIEKGTDQDWGIMCYPPLA